MRHLIAMLPQQSHPDSLHMLSVRPTQCNCLTEANSSRSTNSQPIYDQRAQAWQLPVGLYQDFPLLSLSPLLICWLLSFLLCVCELLVHVGVFETSSSQIERKKQRREEKREPKRAETSMQPNRFDSNQPTNH